MAQIIGYRKDRLGARIIALGNLLWLQDKFGVDVRYLWPDGFEDHDMAVENSEGPIFDAVFQSQYIEQIQQDAKVETGDLTDIDTIRSRVGTRQMADRVKSGERFLCSEGLHPLLFSDEIGPNRLNGFQAAFDQIIWSPRVQQVLDQAADKLAAIEGTPLALHVRRGDVLDKEPWCHKNWVSKFAPDEFYYTVMDRPDTATVLFSDTPEVVSRMAAPRPNAVTLEDLVDAPDLSEMQRDLVELLLMAKCSNIVAPSLSAFSSSASMIGGMGITELPHDLPEEDRFAAYDLLLDRVLTEPESFHNTGDYAQSLGYAFRHALNVQRHKDLFASLKSVMDAGQDYAFYRPLLMALSIASGKPELALVQDQLAQSDRNIWPEDALICKTLGRVADHIIGHRRQASEQFLQLYLARHKTDPDQDALAHYFFQQESLFRDYFLLDKSALDKLSYGREKERIFLFPIDDDMHDGALNSAFPFWVPAGDWPELFEKKKQIIKNIGKDPGLTAKKALIPIEIREAEKAFFHSDADLPADDEALQLLSVYSSALALSGRYRRAAKLMFFCRDKRPRNPLFLKRLANRFQATGHVEPARRNLDRARSVLPDHPGLALARAQLAADENDLKTARNILDEAGTQPNLPLAYYKLWEMVLRKSKARRAAKDVITEASKQFGDHQIFSKQWADKA